MATTAGSGSSASSRATARSGQSLRTGSSVLIAILASVATLFIARELLVPIAMALFFNTLFRPLIRRVEKIGVPAPISSAILVVLLIGGILGMGALLLPQARNFIERAPDNLHVARQRMESLWKPLQQVSDAAAELGSSTGGVDKPTVTVMPVESSRVGALFGTTAAVVAGMVEVLLLLYLLLASGGVFLERLTAILPTRADKRTAVAIVGEVENAVSAYLGATVLINIVESVAVGFSMWALGMPAPLLWGVLTLFLELVPYLGGAVLVFILTISAMATFDTVGHALLAPLAYLVISVLQNYVLSPLLYGNRLKLNAISVLLAVVFWWFVWGVAGAFLAVPILAALKILCDHIETLGPLGKFLEA